MVTGIIKATLQAAVEGAIWRSCYETEARLERCGSIDISSGAIVAMDGSIPGDAAVTVPVDASGRFSAWRIDYLGEIGCSGFLLKDDIRLETDRHGRPMFFHGDGEDEPIGEALLTIEHVADLDIEAASFTLLDKTAYDAMGEEERCRIAWSRYTEMAVADGGCDPHGSDRLLRYLHLGTGGDGCLDIYAIRYSDEVVGAFVAS